MPAGSSRRLQARRAGTATAAAHVSQLRTNRVCDLLQRQQRPLHCCRLPANLQGCCCHPHWPPLSNNFIHSNAPVAHKRNLLQTGVRRDDGAHLLCHPPPTHVDAWRRRSVHGEFESRTEPHAQEEQRSQAQVILYSLQPAAAELAINTSKGCSATGCWQHPPSPVASALLTALACTNTLPAAGCAASRAMKRPHCGRVDVCAKLTWQFAKRGARRREGRHALRYAALRAGRQRRRSRTIATPRPVPTCQSKPQMPCTSTMRWRGAGALATSGGDMAGGARRRSRRAARSCARQLAAPRGLGSAWERKAPPLCDPWVLFPRLKALAGAGGPLGGQKVTGLGSCDLDVLLPSPYLIA